MYKKLMLICICLASFKLHSSQTKLVVGTNAEFPPFCFIENRKIVGFDIDVASEVAKRLGKEMVLKDMPFDALIPEVTLGRVDLVAAGMSYTEERAKRVLFTKSYLKTDPLVVFSKGKTAMSFDDVQGKKIVVVEGFTSDQLMSTKKGVDLVRLNNQTDAFTAVKTGRAEAFITAKSTVDTFLRAQEAMVCQDGSQYYIETIPESGQTCALMIPKLKPEILEEVQKALDAMENDGTMNKLKEKWNLR